MGAPPPSRANNILRRPQRQIRGAAMRPRRLYNLCASFRSPLSPFPVRSASARYTCAGATSSRCGRRSPPWPPTADDVAAGKRSGALAPLHGFPRSAPQTTAPGHKDRNDPRGVPLLEGRYSPSRRSLTVCRGASAAPPSRLYLPLLHWLRRPTSVCCFSLSTSTARASAAVRDTSLFSFFRSFFFFILRRSCKKSLVWISFCARAFAHARS